LKLTTQTNLSWPGSQFKQDQGKEQNKKPRKNSIKALDGVRAIAALLVLSSHLNGLAGSPWNLKEFPLLESTLAVFGVSGVELFFSLSGSLLFMPYAKAMLFQTEWPSTRTFYLRRIFRIWPAYYFILAMMILFFELEYLQPAYWKRLALFLTFFMDSSPKTWQQLDGPFWTLAIEWQFYILLPLIA
jgi:peptidoglycan/LPS O-acetylase OafA/YrhL